MGKNQTSFIEMVKPNKELSDMIVNSVYLHSFYNSYQNFTKQHKIQSTNAVNEAKWNKRFDAMIERQKAREETFLKEFNFSSVQELQRAVEAVDKEMVSSVSEEVSSTLMDQWYKELMEVMKELDVTTNNIQDVNSVIAETERAFDNLAKKYNSKNALVGIEATKEAIKNRLSNKSQQDWLENIKKGHYFTKSAKSISGDFLEYSISDILNKLKRKSKNNKITVDVIGGPDTNVRTSSGKQPKTDIRVSIGGTDYGVQAKRYSEKQGEDIVLHWFTKEKDQAYNLSGRTIDEVLEYFSFKKIDPSLMSEDLVMLKSIAQKILTDKTLHYQLVNEYYLSEYGKTIEGTTKFGLQTNTLDDLLSFLVKTLPYFMGSQMTIEPDINVDFFNINGRFIPVSDILRRVFKEGNISNNGAQYNISLYLNDPPDANKFLAEKRKKNQHGNVYTAERIAYGGKKGQELYNKMRIGSAHLNLQYDYIRQFR